MGFPFAGLHMKFTELTVHTTGEGSELVSDILWDYSHYGVAIADAADVVRLAAARDVRFDYIEEGLFRAGGEVLVKGYIPLDVADEAVREIGERLGRLRANSPFDLGTLEAVRRTVEGDDWIEIWKKHFRPIRLGRVTVVPEWMEYGAAEGEKVLLIDSNMAFGTGEHETTAMCVELLQKHMRAGDTVIDVGCGSGILGISALLLGAGRAVMTDIDYVAVQSAKHNAEMNGVADRAEVSLANLLESTPATGRTVLANITAEVLLSLAGDIPRHLERGGRLILSGIIHSRLDAVVRAFEAQRLSLVERKARGEWNALVFGRD